MPDGSSEPDGRYNPYAGWIGAGVVILAVLVVGAILWFTYHPI